MGRKILSCLRHPWKWDISSVGLFQVLRTPFDALTAAFVFPPCILSTYYSYILASNSHPKVLNTFVFLLSRFLFGSMKPTSSSDTPSSVPVDLRSLTASNLEQELRMQRHTYTQDWQGTVNKSCFQHLDLAGTQSARSSNSWQVYICCQIEQHRSLQRDG